jgi:ABC-type dipeptide/oligopeptide/nickel transport system permease subunit
VYERKDLLWLAIWLFGLLLLWTWDIIFLNAPALERVERAFLHSAWTGILVVICSLLLGWLLGVSLHMLERSGSTNTLGFVTMVLNILRSIPQIFIILIGYVVFTLSLQGELLRADLQFLWIAGVISLALLLSVVDTVRARLDYFSSLDFVNAMLACGISEWRIINVEILWKNSRGHLIHKMIEIFGASIFLQCSIDFIVSVGLSTDVSLSNVPLTLGSLLASLDSKQDILAISNLWSDPGYLPMILVKHLLGITVAVLIVFTLLCVYNIANAYNRRNKLT